MTRNNYAPAKPRTAIMAHAHRCRICGPKTSTPRTEGCIGCGEVFAVVTCVPGYCRACSHDPSWEKVGQGKHRKATGRRAAGASQ